MKLFKVNRRQYAQRAGKASESKGEQQRGIHQWKAVWLKAIWRKDIGKDTIREMNKENKND